MYIVWTWWADATATASGTAIAAALVVDNK